MIVGPGQSRQQGANAHLWDSCMFRRCVFYTLLERLYLNQVLIRGIIITANSDRRRILI